MSYIPDMHRMMDLNGNTYRACDTCWNHTSTWAENECFSPPHVSYDIIGSRRRFGVELETSRCPNYRTIHNNTIFGAKYDGSISGMEFVSPVLYGDEGLQEVIKICAIGRKLGWQTNSDCGLHIHCDMTGEGTDTCKRVAYAYTLTYPMWQTFVTQYRAYDCRYCESLNLLLEEIEDSDNWSLQCRNMSRYYGINFASLYRHGTYEIRLHQGSLNGRSISAWIRLHLRFIDAVRELSSYTQIKEVFGHTLDSNWVALKKILNDSYLSRYYGRRKVQHERILEGMLNV
jgi:hypothetical protein